MGAPAIALTGLTATEVLPGIYIEVNFAQGPAVGAGLTRALLILCNKSSLGSAANDTTIYGPDTPVPLATEPQMIQLGGTGSEGHRMFQKIAKITGGRNGPPVYWLFVTESAGAKATGTVTIANNATGPGTHRLYVGDEFVETSIESGETPTQIAVKIVNNVNTKTHWAVTAGNAAGVVTLTARQNGPRGNWIRYQAQIIANTSIATTTTATTDAFFTGGTTADSNATALTTIAARFFYYIVSAAEDATQVGALVSQVLTQATPLNGIRQRVVFASVDTPANAISIAVGVNAARAEMVHSEKNPFTPAELAAHNAIIYAIEEADELGFRTNFVDYGLDEKTRPNWKVPPPRLDAAQPTPSTLRSLLTNGISPIGVTAVGTTYLVDRFTTRSLNGAVPETRIRESHKVTICDRFADNLGARIRVAGAGKVIADDLPNNQAPLPGTFTPRMGKILVYQTLDDFASNVKAQSGVDPNTGVDRLKQQKEGSVVQREQFTPTRMGFRVPLQTADNWRQGALAIDQVA